MKKFWSMILIVSFVIVMVVGCKGGDSKKPTVVEENKPSQVEKKENNETGTSEQDKGKAPSVEKEEPSSRGEEKLDKAYREILGNLKNEDFDITGVDKKAKFSYAKLNIGNDELSELLVTADSGDGLLDTIIYTYDKNSDKVIKINQVITLSPKNTLYHYKNSLVIVGFSPTTMTNEVVQTTLHGSKLVDKSLYSGKSNKQPDFGLKEIKWTPVNESSKTNGNSKTVNSGGYIKIPGIKLPPDVEPIRPAAKIDAEKAKGRIVFKGMVINLSGKELIDIHNKENNDSFKGNDKAQLKERVTVLVITRRNVSGLTFNGTSTRKAYLIGIRDMPKYNGKMVYMSINPKKIYWPSDSSVPLGQPGTDDAIVLE